MAKVFIEETTLTAIGDAIRGKTGKTELIDPANMSTEIAGIQAGGGGDIPEAAFVINGSAQYKFSYDSWNWFINEYGTRITTKDISNISFMCGNSKQLTSLPFVINVKNLGTADSAFNYCQALSTCPKIRGTFSKTASFGSLLSYCFNLRDVEDLFLAEDFDLFSTVKWTSAYSGPRPPSFSSTYSLRRVPSWWYKFRVDESSTTAPSTSYTSYYQAFYGCYSLDEVTNMPVITAGTLTSNCFSNTFTNCGRLKHITFETEADGSPKIASWKSQTLDLTKTSVVYTPAYVIGYNSGITEATKVTDDASYQALKNDPDWWTSLESYARYGHDSAVETINSLPDTSTYLGAFGGTNTIKFLSRMGSAIDGGGISALTEEEIAVAAAKGWTVTIS